MPWKPPSPGELPTLGYEVIDWIHAHLLAPDTADAVPFVLYREQAEFLLRFYELDAETGRRVIRRAVLSRPRGWGKSPLLAAIACAEALGPVLFDGWDAEGLPVGKSWATVRTPLVQVAAVSETQTKNTWSPLLEMLDGPACDAYPGLELLDTFVVLPRGRIEPITSSARTVKGNRACFAVLDQTEEWIVANGGIRLAETMRINASKIGGTTIESPNAFIPGEGSVAEESAVYWKAILEGRALEGGLLYDHREAPAETDLHDPDSLYEGLLVSYGDSAQEAGGHMDLERVGRDIRDLNIPEQRAASDYLNQITHASDAWVTQPEWAARVDATKIVADRDRIVLGFDGSRKRTHGVTDATVLVGVRVSDGHVFEIAVWEQPDGPASVGWEVPAVEVNAAIAMAFGRWTIVGFFADPPLWESHIAEWEAKYGSKLTVKASQQSPIKWWTNRPTVMASALEALHSAVVDGELSHDGAYALTRHVLNARRRIRNGHLLIAKENQHSARKIDGAIALTLAWQARLLAVARVPQSSGFIPRRIR